MNFSDRAQRNRPKRVHFQFGTFEATYMSIADAYPKLLLKKAWVTKLFFCIISMLMGLPMMMQGGYYIYTLVDWYQAAFVMVIAFVQVVGMAYAYGSGRIRANIRLMTGVRMTIFWDVVWGGILPAILLVLFVVTIMDYSTPNYGDYEFPAAAAACGWMFAACGLVPLPILMLCIVIRERENLRNLPPGTGKSLMSMMKRLLSPTPEWERERNRCLREDPELRDRLAKMCGNLGPQGNELSPLSHA